ncbi:MAG: cation:proton antiporter [Dongiaceae bacterium]
MSQIAVTVLGVTGLLALVSLLPPVAKRLNLPFSVLLAVVGCALGAIVIAVHDTHAMGMAGHFVAALQGLDVSAEAFLYIFLPTLLFESALAIDVRRLMDDVGPILLLAVVAVLVCTLVVGFTLELVADVGLTACLLLGAIVATTDPAAVVGIFRDLGAPRRLAILVEGESLFNDAAAIALFSLLVAMLAGAREADAVGTIIAFLQSFIGGGIVGYVGARIMCALVGFLRGLRLAEVTLTVALAYLVFVIGEHYLHVSGVVAVVTAGLTIGSHGRVRITPSTWDTLVETWEQLGFWASSLIFLLAAMLVPRLLLDVGWQDAYLLAVLVVATLIARAIVLYGMLPLLSAVGVANRVSNPYKMVILWGGLRGAVSLALALAVTENMAVSAEIRHFIAVLTTGFVLFTLFVNGTSLRALIRLLQLDRLSPVDRAVRDRALELSLRSIKEQLQQVAVSDGIDRSVAVGVIDEYAKRVSAVETTIRENAELGPDELLNVGLVTLASREHELYLERFKDRIISRRIIGALVAQAGRVLDGAKTEGRPGYEEAAKSVLGFSRSLRAAIFLQHRLGLDRPLTALLADRFESLLIGRLILQQLIKFNEEQLGPLLGATVGARLTEILTDRLYDTEQALEALKLQYPDYARTLENRYLGRVAARLEGHGYDAMLHQTMISREVHSDLDRRLGARRHELDQRPSLDIAMKREAMIARVPLFEGLDSERLDKIARLLRPRLALPSEAVVRKGERGDAMYFIASGAVEVRLEPLPVRLGSGEFFGEIALVTNLPRMADVVALGYCRLLELSARDFERLLETDGALRERIDAVARQRMANVPAAK